MIKLLCYFLVGIGFGIIFTRSDREDYYGLFTIIFLFWPIVLLIFFVLMLRVLIKVIFSGLE